MAVKGIPWDASEYMEERLRDKAWRKVRENPMVPIDYCDRSPRWKYFELIMACGRGGGADNLPPHMRSLGVLGGCIILGHSIKSIKNITDRRLENLSPIFSRMRLASHSFAMGAIMLGVLFSLYRDYEKCFNDKNQTSLEK